MTAREQLPADFSECSQAAARQVIKVDGAFVVVELAHQVLAAADVRPAEERVGLQLHGSLAVGDALAVVVVRMGIGQIGV
jgi:hypothetical protein